MEKINIVEILKNCPKGMELYSPIYGVGVLTKVTDRIHVKFPKEHNVKCFRLDGKVSEDGEIMLYPKGKTTWEGFVPPCKFKDGDIIFTHSNFLKEGVGIFWISIFKEKRNGGVVTYVDYAVNNCEYYGDEDILCNERDILCQRFATEEEKEKLFKAIKDNGYRWDEETKTLKKLPTFKVGDSVKSKINQYIYTITDIAEDVYIMHYATDYVTDKFGYHVPFCDEDKFELVSNKFDITTLIPFESKVLVRGDKTSYWKPAIFGCYMKNMTVPYYALGGTCWSQCVPYEGNEHLFGKTDDCDDFYKTWE